MPSKHRPSEACFVALLRGVNVGGKNRVAMPDLASAFESLGAVGVRTYLQSGNIVFRATPPIARRIHTLAQDAIRDRCGVDAPVILRSASRLRAIIEGCPFDREAGDELHVMFLRDPPTPQALAGLDPRRSLPDQYVAQGDEVYLRLPSGVARTKLTNAYFDRALNTITTSRNWRTVTALAAMADG